MLWQGVLQMPKVYKTSSGTFSEDELAVAIWLNPKRNAKRPQARMLETLTSEKSSYPIAFPIAKLQQIKSWMFCPVATTTEELDTHLASKEITRQNPVLVPLTLARLALGWDTFHIPSEYTEK